MSSLVDGSFTSSPTDRLINQEEKISCWAWSSIFWYATRKQSLMYQIAWLFDCFDCFPTEKPVLHVSNSATCGLFLTKDSSKHVLIRMVSLVLFPHTKNTGKESKETPMTTHFYNEPVLKMKLWMRVKVAVFSAVWIKPLSMVLSSWKLPPSHTHTHTHTHTPHTHTHTHTHTPHLEALNSRPAKKRADHFYIMPYHYSSSLRPFCSCSYQQIWTCFSFTIVLHL